MFEALPQTILQTYIVVKHIYHGVYVTKLRYVSLSTSYLSLSFSLVRALRDQKCFLSSLRVCISVTPDG